MLYEGLRGCLAILFVGLFVRDISTDEIYALDVESP